MVATGGQLWRSATVNDGGPPLTTAGPPVNHWSTMVDRQSIGGSTRKVRLGLRPGQVGSWAGSSRGMPRRFTCAHVDADVDFNNYTPSRIELGTSRVETNDSSHWARAWF
ncbi:hypothetical protein Tco_1321580 [Tanacetum coccineum]